MNTLQNDKQFPSGETARTRTVISNGPDDTQALARSLVSGLPESVVIALYGNMGSGKTCFVQGIADALEIDRLITSPTFTMINEYRGTRCLYHIDLYRVRHSDELIGLDVDDYLEPDGITAIEWPERAEALLPARTVRVRIEAMARPNQRRIVVEVS